MYYVYIALDKDIPRYVGVGKGTRLKHVNSGASHVRRLNYEVLVNNKTFDVSILINNLTANQAYAFEKELIIKYGLEFNNTGTLFNETKGGKGFTGFVNEERKIKISEFHKNRWNELKKDKIKYEKLITNLKKPNSGQFKKGHKVTWELGQPKKWILKNLTTNECFIFSNKQEFSKKNGFGFLKYMKPNHNYKQGNKHGWFLCSQ